MAEHAASRLQIAQRAAQLMADSGIQDYAFAKRKAARQLGLNERHGLPSNDEVDNALITHRTLFEAESLASEVRALRLQALEVMKLLEPFQPLAAGGVVTGAISAHSNIEIEIYTDSSKAFERFLFNQGIDFKTEEGSVSSGFLLFAEPADVLVRILPPQLRHASRPGKSETSRHLTVTQLANLLDQDGKDEDGNRATDG